MARELSDEDRRVFVQTLKQVEQHWQRVFRDDEFYSLNYYELFTEIWLKGGEPVYKTDCYRFMSGVSPQTAKKYLQRAITRGYLREGDNPLDKRSKLITMSPQLKTVIERNFDYTAAKLRKALQRRRATPSLSARGAANDLLKARQTMAPGQQSKR